jgi:hypothetical protein
MDTLVKSCPIREPINQHESSGSSSDAYIFPNKFRLNVQSYVSSSDSSFSDMSSSSSEDDAYEPSFTSSINPASTSLSSDGVSWDWIVGKGTSGSICSVPYTSTSISVDIT